MLLLKNCKYCHVQPEVLTIKPRLDETRPYRYLAECPVCHSQTALHPTKKESAHHWNEIQRKQPSAHSRETVPYAHETREHTKSYTNSPLQQPKP